MINNIYFSPILNRCGGSVMVPHEDWKAEVTIMGRWFNSAIGEKILFFLKFLSLLSFLFLGHTNHFLVCIHWKNKSIDAVNEICTTTDKSTNLLNSKINWAWKTFSFRLFLRFYLTITILSNKGRHFVCFLLAKYYQMDVKTWNRKKFTGIDQSSERVPFFTS